MPQDLFKEALVLIENAFPRKEIGSCAGAERIRDVAQGSFLGVADLHAADPQESTF
jgi:hypothetical protein